MIFFILKKLFLVRNIYVKNFRKDDVTIKAEPGSPLHSEHEVSPQSISQSG